MHSYSHIITSWSDVLLQSIARLWFCNAMSIAIRHCNRQHFPFSGIHSKLTASIPCFLTLLRIYGIHTQFRYDGMHGSLYSGHLRSFMYMCVAWMAATTVWLFFFSIVCCTGTCWQSLWISSFSCQDTCDGVLHIQRGGFYPQDRCLWSELLV